MLTVPPPAGLTIGGKMLLTGGLIQAFESTNKRKSMELKSDPTAKKDSVELKVED